MHVLFFKHLNLVKVRGVLTRARVQLLGGELVIEHGAWRLLATIGRWVPELLQLTVHGTRDTNRTIRVGLDLITHIVCNASFATITWLYRLEIISVHYILLLPSLVRETSV